MNYMECKLYFIAHINYYRFRTKRVYIMSNFNILNQAGVAVPVGGGLGRRVDV